MADSIGGIFDTIASSLTDQMELKQRQIDETEANTAKRINLTAKAKREQEVVLDQSRRSNEATWSNQLDTLSGIDLQIQKANEAIRLSDSDNPLDRIQLWAMQQGDPSYTAEGNLRRINYLSQAASAQGLANTINQQQYQQQLEQISSNLEAQMLGDDTQLGLLNAQVEAGQNRIEAAKDTLANMAGMLQNRNSIQESVLSNLDLTQAKSAQEEAGRSKDGTASVGGVPISKAKLDARVYDLGQQNYLKQVLSLNDSELTLTDMSPDQIDIAIADAQNNENRMADVDGTPISLARLQERKATILSSDTKLKAAQQANMQQTQSLRDTTNRELLNHMSLVDLNKVLLNGGKIPDVKKPVSLSMVREVMAEKQGAQQAALENELALGTMMTPDREAAKFVEESDLLQIDPLSPAATKIKNQKERIMLLAERTANQPDQPAAKIIMSQMTAAERERRDKIIEAEADRLAAGDKNLSRAYNFQMRGQQIPEALIVQSLTEGFKSGSSLAQWLTPEQAGIFQNTVMSAKQQLMQTSAGLMSNADIEAAAIQEGIKAVRGRLSGDTTAKLMAFMATPGNTGGGKYGNPLAGVVSPTQNLNLMSQADADGAQRYQKAHNLSDEEMLKFLSGSESNTELAAIQNAAYLEALDRIKPGLADQTVTWWESNAAVQSAAEFAQVQIANADTIQKASEQALIMPGLQNDIQFYASSLRDGQMKRTAIKLNGDNVEFTAFGGNPQVKQAFLLQQASNLTDSEKQQVYSGIIKPLLDQAAQQGLSPQETSNYVETQLKGGFGSDNAALRLQRKKLMETRDAAIGTLDAFVTAPSLTPYVPEGVVGSDIPNTVSGMINGLVKLGYDNWIPQHMDKVTSHYGWWQELQGQQ